MGPGPPGSGALTVFHAPLSRAQPTHVGSGSASPAVTAAAAARDAHARAARALAYVIPTLHCATPRDGDMTSIVLFRSQMSLCLLTCALCRQDTRYGTGGPTPSSAAPPHAYPKYGGDADTTAAPAPGGAHAWGGHAFLGAPLAAPPVSFGMGFGSPSMDGPGSVRPGTRGHSSM